MTKKEKKIWKLIRKNYKKLSEDIKKDVADLYEKYGKDIEKEFYKYNRNLKLSQQLSTLVFALYEENNKLINRLLKDTVKSARTEIKGFKADIDEKKIINSDISGLKWIERQNLHRNETVKMIQSEIVRGIKRGARYEDVARELSHRLSVSEKKTMRIVRTESHRVLNEAKFETYKDYQKKGFKIKKQWISANDERTRSSHAQLDGQVVDIDEPFKINGKEAMYPGDFGYPEEDINCRCTIKIIID